MIKLNIMIRESLLQELKFEANNTRKLFSAIPNEVLDYKPNEFNWTLAELAAHTAHLYHWWDATLNLDFLEMTEYHYDKGDISTMDSITQKLEENIALAVKCLENYPEEKLNDLWHMQNQGIPLMEPMSRIQVIRSFLMNHLYHHRGEIVAYLRAAGQKVPGLYGPSYEEQEAMKDKST